MIYNIIIIIIIMNVINKVQFYILSVSARTGWKITKKVGWKCKFSTL
jgi:hypothetical protein